MTAWTSAKACGEAACIEAAILPSGRICIRDSKRPLSEYFVTSSEDFKVFVTGAKAGDFDHLIANIEDTE